MDLRRKGFGPALQHFRERQRISQSTLATRAGYDHSFVSRLESEVRSPTLEAVDRFARALGLSQFDADQLRIAAGFTPARLESMYLNPGLGTLDQAISSAPEPMRQWALETINAVTRHLGNRS